jgi:Mg-chelatase subunit ChlI
MTRATFPRASGNRAEQRAAKARQGRSERVTNNGRRRKSYAGQRRAKRWRAEHDGVPAGRAQAATEYCAGGSRMMDIRGRRGKRSEKHGPNTDRPQSSRRQRCEYGMASRKKKRRNEGGGYSAANSKGTIARVCRPCLSGTRAWAVKA